MLLTRALLTMACHGDEAWLLTLGMHLDDIIIQGNNASGGNAVPVNNDSLKGHIVGEP